MRLAVAELISTLSQTLTTGAKPTFVEAVRPHLIRVGNPAGSLQMQILSADGSTVVATSETISIALLNPEAAHAHGYYRFFVNAGLRANTQYQFKLISSGYSFAEGSYIGWVNGCDLGKYPPTTTPPDLLQWPLDIEVWHRKQV